MVNELDRAAWDAWVDTLGSAVSEPERSPVVRTGKRQPIPYEVRRAVRSRDHNRCVVCHWSPDVDPSDSRHLEVDHIFPWSAGGPDTSDNLRTLCNVCNAKRSNWTADHWYTRPAKPIVLYCYPCRMPSSRPNVGAIDVYCGNCERPSWTIAAYPPV